MLALLVAACQKASRSALTRAAAAPFPACNPSPPRPPPSPRPPSPPPPPPPPSPLLPPSPSPPPPSPPLQPMCRPLGNWLALASDSGGLKLVSATYNGLLYTTNGGAVGGYCTTALTAAGRRSWTSVAAAANGTRLLALERFQTGSTGGQLFLSTDTGSTWAALGGAGRAFWTSVASSSNGTRLAAAAANLGLYTSSNGGASWVLGSAPAAYYTALASSSDGLRLVASVYGGYLYTSTDGGTT
ncbi:hypothetical protein ABPG75_011120 [Micractinium tetrahymenae]